MRDVIIPKTTITCPLSLNESETPPTLTKIFQLIVFPCCPPQQLPAQAERGVWGRAEMCKSRAEKGPFIWQMFFAWEIILQHSKRLNLLPVSSSPTQLSLWLYRHIRDFFSCIFEENCIRGRQQLTDLNSSQGLPAYFRCDIYTALKQWIAIDQEPLSAFLKWNEHSGSTFLPLYSRVLHTDI